AIVVVGADTPRGVARVGLSCSLGTVLALPALFPYVRMAAHGTRRPLEQVAQLSATLSGYLVSTSRIDFWWGRHFFTNGLDLFFPGVVAVVLAAVGVADAVRTGGDARRPSSPL